MNFFLRGTPFLVSVWSAAKVCSTLGNSRRSIRLVHKDVVNEEPMFGSRIHLGCLKSTLLLEDGVGDDKLLLSAKLQQQAPIVVAVTNAVSAKYSFLGTCNLAHSIIEITKVYLLVVCWGALETAVELREELVFFFCSKSWNVHKRGIPLIFLRKAHWHHVVGMTIWQIFQPGGNEGADHEAYAWKVPLCCRFPWSE